jgi:hypothetical protein
MLSSVTVVRKDVQFSPNRKARVMITVVTEHRGGRQARAPGNDFIARCRQPWHGRLGAKLLHQSGAKKRFEPSAKPGAERRRT